jgi:putative endonuclease
MAQAPDEFYVYIAASGRNGTIYVGSTDDLAKRIWEHQSKVRDGFTKTYGCDQLVWFEGFESRHNAFRRERQIKEWRRSWKLQLIEETNPTWRDFYETLNGEPDPDGALGSGSRRSPE